MDVSQGIHYRVVVIYLLSKLGIKEGAGASRCSEFSLHQLGSRRVVFISPWTTHHCILNQMCATRRAAVGVGLAYAGTFVVARAHSILNALI